jgi:exodeoxyribonuclease-3
MCAAKPSAVPAKYADEDPAERWAVVPRPDGVLRVASVNVNGVRAAFRKGMAAWVAAAAPDVLALQEVRASTADLEALVASLPGAWVTAHDASVAKGRAGVAVVSRFPLEVAAVGLPDDSFDSSGRWLETRVRPAGAEPVTVVSAYIPTGGAGTPKQVHKMAFLAAMRQRMSVLLAGGDRVSVMGDWNVGRDERDIKNWRGNVKHSGFLPEERELLAGIFAEGWVDEGRQFAGDVPGPYTWWSMRGHAFDNDAGWRIDYHADSPALAEHADAYHVDRAPNWAARWTDHTPTVVDYRVG